MRLKVSTVHPLSPFKAWFMLDTLADNVDTVFHLKRTLCARLPLGLDDCNITLVMDDYVLLDDSPVSILRDGDAICIKHVPPAALSTDSVPLPVTRKRKRRISTSSESSSSSSSNSSSSDPSSSSDHSSLSTSTDSDSDSDSNTDEPEPPCQSVDKRAVLTAKSQDLQKSISPVPPGYGKPSTRNRNLRRRRKRLAERDKPTQGPLAPTSGANAVVPLPIQQTSLAHTSSEPNLEHSGPQVMMMSLRNKNKKKNFRQLMDKPLPPKIVFTELENTPVSSEPPHVGSLIPVKDSVPSVKCASLIPPSERDDLPSNIFVTSIDVEEGMWPKNKRKSIQKPIALSHNDESCTADFSLDYGSTEVPAAASEPPEVLHRHAEQQWDLLQKITNMPQVEVDSIVAHKALAINPATFTPEILTMVARVTCLSSTHVTVRPLQHSAQVSFGGVTEETEADVEDETHTWADVFASEWRIVR